MQAGARSAIRLFAQNLLAKIIESPVGSCHKSFFDRESPAVFRRDADFNERNQETDACHSLKVEYV